MHISIMPSGVWGWYNSGLHVNGVGESVGALVCWRYTRRGGWCVDGRESSKGTYIIMRERVCSNVCV